MDISISRCGSFRCPRFLKAACQANLFAALVLIAALVAGRTASADVIINDLGDRGDGYYLAQIVYSGSGGNTGSWTVPYGTTSVQLLVVGGGGAGARGGAFGNAGSGGGSPGGGAGGLYYTSSYSVSPFNTISLAIGVGAATTTTTGNGANGGNSVFGPIIAYGGQGGQYVANQGGNQGGYSTNGGVNVTPGFSGGTGNGATGGAGAGQNGRNGGFSPAYGGAGVTNSITGTYGVIGANGLPFATITAQSGSAPFVPIYGGTAVGYAGGGSAGYDGVALGTQYGESYGGGSGSWPEGVAGTPGFDTLGGGGGGGRSANGGGGGDGVIYIAFQVPEPSTYALLGAGALTLLLRRRLRR